MDLAQEHPGLGTLDDPMIVGGGDRNYLREPEIGQGGRICGFEAGGVGDRADSDDETLAGHQPRHGLQRADGAGVGEGDGRAGEVVGADLVVADPADRVLVARGELPEAEGVGLFDAGDHECAGAV